MMLLLKHCLALIQQHFQQGTFKDQSLSAHSTVIVTDVSARLVTVQRNCDEKGEYHAMILCDIFLLYKFVSFFSQVLGCVSQISFILLCKTGSCFMVRQREIMCCTVKALSRSNSKLDNYISYTPPTCINSGVADRQVIKEERAN